MFIEGVATDLVIIVNLQVKLSYNGVSTRCSKQHPLQSKELTVPDCATNVDHISFINLSE